MNILILLGFLSFAFATGEQDCSSKGPEYWCKNEATANRCHAVSYCKEYVWPKKEMEAPKTDMCTYCQQFVGTLHMMLMQNGSQAEVIAALKGFCNLLPATGKIVCLLAVDRYGPTIVQDILKYTQDPRKFCKLIELCTSNSKDVVNLLALLKKLVLKKVDADYCTPCKGYVNGLNSITSTKTKSDLVRALKKMCKIFPEAVANMCPILMDSHGEQLAGLVFGYLSDASRVCATLALCRNARKDESKVLVKPDEYVLFVPEKKTLKAPTKPNNFITCELCTLAMQRLENMLTKNSTESEVKAALDRLCDFLPAPIKSSCLAMIEQYADKIMDLLIGEVPPRFICKEIGLCASSNKISFKKVSSNKASLKKVSLQKKWKDAEKETSGSMCDVCIYAIGYLDSIVGNNRTEEYIKQKLDQLCDMLPKSLALECGSMVNQYEHDIIRLLIDEMSPSLICQELHLCRSAGSVSYSASDVASSASNAVSFVSNVGNFVSNVGSIQCDLCKYDVSTMYKALSDKQTQERMRNALVQLCSHITTPSVQEECKSLVASDFKKFLNTVLDVLKDPTLLCKVAKMCRESDNKGAVSYSASNAVSSASNAVSFVSNVGNFVSNVGSAQCELCKYVVSTMYKALSDKPTQERIRNAMVQLCSHITTPSVQEECKSLIASDFKEFLNIVLGELKDPTLLCKVAKMCPESDNKAMYKVDGSLCETCVSGLTYADTLLKQNSTQQMFRAALDQICGALPTWIQAECKVYADKYANYVINFLLAQLKNPLKICKELYLCTANQVVVVKKLSWSFNFNFKSSVQCQMCEFAIQTVGPMFNKEVQTAIKNDVLKICKILPTSLAGECTTLVSQYFDMIMGIIAEKLKDPLECCKELQMCPTSGKKAYSYSVKTSIRCEACEYGAKYLHSFLGKQGTKPAIKNDLLSVCNSLPSPLAAECVSMVTKYYDLAYQFLLLESASPEGFCTLLKMCAASNAPTNELSMSLPIFCEACEMGVQYISTYMSRNGTEAEIKGLLITACSALGETLGAECVALVGQYYAGIYAMLIQQLANPQALCTEFGLCSSASIVNVIKPYNFYKLDGFNRVQNLLKMKRMKEPIISKLATSKNTFTCEICDFTLIELKKMLETKHERDMVIKALDHVCGRLPSSLRTECTNLVEFYAPQIIAFVSEEMKDPATFCKELGLCSENLKKLALYLKNDGYVARAMSSVGHFDETCQMCMFVTGKLDTQINKGTPKKKIQRKLKAVCAHSRLPAERKEECTRMIEEYEDVIMQLVQAVQLPYLCQKIGECVSMPEQVNGLIPKIEQGLRSRNGGRLCLVCEYAMGVVDKLLGAQTTKDHIIALVHMVCNKLPNTLFVDECNTLIGQYGDEIIQLFLNQVMAPVEVCTTLDLC